jgi:hypothetical protein
MQYFYSYYPLIYDSHHSIRNVDEVVRRKFKLNTEAV